MSWRVRDVDAGRRLVEHQQLWLAQQSASEEHALLLTARELADVALPDSSAMPSRSSSLLHLGAVRATCSRAAASRGAGHQTRTRRR